MRLAALTCAAAVALVPGLAAAGCGGGGGDSSTSALSAAPAPPAQLDKAGYIKAMQAKLEPLSAAVARLQTDLPGSGQGPDWIAKAVPVFEGLRDSLNRAADDIETIGPPDEVKNAHTVLVGAVRDFGNYMDQLATAARNADQARLQQLVSTQPPFLAALDQATKEFGAKGYDVASSVAGGG